RVAGTAGASGGVARGSPPPGRTTRGGHRGAVAVRPLSAELPALRRAAPAPGGVGTLRRAAHRGKYRGHPARHLRGPDVVAGGAAGGFGRRGDHDVGTGVGAPAPCPARGRSGGVGTAGEAVPGEALVTD